MASVAVGAAFAIALPASATGSADKPTGAMIVAQATTAAPTGIVAQATTAAPTGMAKSATKTTTAKASHSEASHSERVESRISEMHTKLKITPAQEGQWNNVAQVMRDNAKTLDTLSQARINNANTMTAVDDLKSYSEITDAHAEGMKKFVAAFQALYDSMSDAQKKEAETLFQGHRGVSRTASKTHS